jgi:polygalacturonase
VTIATPFAAPDDSLTFTPPTIPCVLYDITAFGAKADGTTMSTSAFAQAVAAAKTAGGGVVYVPAGTFLSGAIHLASATELHLEKGATIKFSASAADYLPAVLTRWEGLDVMNYSPLVYALDATDVAITGDGTLQGPGNAWGGGTVGLATAAVAVDNMVYRTYVAALPKGVGTVPPPPDAIQANGGAPALRPTFVECNGCRNFLIEGVTVTGPPYWTLHPVYSSNVIIRNMIVSSTGPTMASNGDGTDPDSCSNCLIDGVTYATSDDNIAIKSGLNEDGIAVGKPSHNLVIRNVRSTTGHGGITIGSEMSGGVNNVFATGNHFLGVEDPVRIKTLNGRGGVIENLWFEDSTLGWTKDAVNLTTQYPSSTIVPHDPTLVPRLTNVHLSGLTGTGTGPVYDFTGPASAIELLNLNLTGSAGTCTMITGITLSNVTFNGALATKLTGC